MLKALILCGGKSTRMGADKGLLQHQDLSWAQHAAQKFSSLDFQYLVSINEEQKQEYLSIFESNILIEDNKTMAAEGPLKGILSAHQRMPNLDIFVLACDMRDIHRDVLRYLVATYTINKAEAFVYSNGDLAEPLCAIYTAKGLQKISALLQLGQLKNWGMQYILHRLDSMYLPIPEKWIPFFRNFNSTEDLS